MCRIAYQAILITTLFGADAAMTLNATLAGESATPLKVVARKQLEGDSRWGVPADLRLIRTFSELVRAVGLDQADDVYREFGKPKIDFERYMLAYVSAGSQRSSGYAVRIFDAVQRRDNGQPEIVIRWSLYEPKGYVLWVITTPAELVMIERGEGEPKFQRIPYSADSDENGTAVEGTAIDPNAASAFKGTAPMENDDPPQNVANRNEPGAGAAVIKESGTSYPNAYSGRCVRLPLNCRRCPCPYLGCGRRVMPSTRGCW